MVSLDLRAAQKRLESVRVAAVPFVISDLFVHPIRDVALSRALPQDVARNFVLFAGIADPLNIVRRLNVPRPSEVTIAEREKTNRTPFSFCILDSASNAGRNGADSTSRIDLESWRSHGAALSPKSPKIVPSELLHKDIE